MGNHIVEWFQRTRLGIDKLPGRGEIKTRCPYCGRENFYFSSTKLVGLCHHAKCARVVTLDDLIQLVGYGPEEDRFPESYPSEKETIEPEISLDGIPPVVTLESDKHHTCYPDVVQYLRGRGLSDDDIYRFDFRFDGSRVYLPILDEKGVLRQYNSRLLYGEGKKYKYASGVDITKFLLGWAECKLWRRLLLVENSFVSIWLRNHLNCTTCFGSLLSDAQVDLIKHSAIESVAILFDEGADARAAASVRKLHKVGVPAAFGSIIDQPDYYDLGSLAVWVNRLHEAAKSGVDRLDFR